MAISDLPGYVQGYKFTDSAAFYDSSGNFFIDQAGYSAFPASRLNIEVGTPSFVDVNSARGMVLDNTVQGRLMMFPVFHGSCIIVMGAPGRIGTNGFLWVTIGGSNVSATSNCGIRYYRVSAADYRHQLFSSGGSSVYANAGNGDGIFATALCLDQENRLCKGIEADGTVTSGATVADNNRGVEGFRDIGGSNADMDRCRGEIFGNLSGVPGDTAALSGSRSMIICEMHFFDSILTDSPTTAVEAELAALEAIYG